MRFYRLTTCVAGLALLLVAPGATRVARAQSQEFQITLTNLTGAQPFSPPVFVTHDSTLGLWRAGETASPGLRQIAEEGDNAALLLDLSLAGSTVGSVFTPLGNPLGPGGSVSFFFTADAAHPLLSSAWMLGRTNDGFSGQSGLDLFGLNGTGTFDLLAYDAGTENNNELALFLPALGGPFNDPENGVIGLHTGIRGDADAPATWNWTGPVARVTIAAVPEPSTGVLIAAGTLFWFATITRRRAERGHTTRT